MAQNKAEFMLMSKKNLFLWIASILTSFPYTMITSRWVDKLITKAEA